MESFTGVKLEYHKNGRIKFESYYENGKLHRIGGPAEITYDKDGTIERKIYYENGKKHRIGGPAEIWYYDNGIISYEIYLENGIHHRIGGPASIFYNETYTEYIYYQDDKYYNPYGPTEFHLNRKNLIVYKDYYQMKKSNVKGPAVIDTVYMTWGIYNLFISDITLSIF